MEQNASKINNYFHCKYCTSEGKDYMTVNACDLHMHVLGQHKSPKGIFCTTCGSFYNSPNSLRIHWMRTKCSVIRQMMKQEYKEYFETLEENEDHSDLVVNQQIKPIPILVIQTAQHRYMKNNKVRRNNLQNKKNHNHTNSHTKTKLPGIKSPDIPKNHMLKHRDNINEANAILPFEPKFDEDDSNDSIIESLTKTDQQSDTSTRKKGKKIFYALLNNIIVY